MLTKFNFTLVKIQFTKKENNNSKIKEGDKEHHTQLIIHNNFGDGLNALLICHASQPLWFACCLSMEWNVLTIYRNLCALF